MANFVGRFYGYREWILKGGGRIALGVWEMEGKIPTRCEVFTGSALDAYPAIQLFSGQSIIMLVQTWDAALLCKLSNDGSTYADPLDVDPDCNMGSWYHRYSAAGFTLQNKAAGSAARYQVVNFYS